MSSDPIDDQVPVNDAVDQRREVGRTPPLAEDFEPTEVNEIAGEVAPEDVDPADWQDQLTSAADSDDWDADDRG
ncbi:MAG TPA: hypothetical protein VH496_05145 [Mycobacterium sp.]